MCLSGRLFDGAVKKKFKNKVYYGDLLLVVGPSRPPHRPSSSIAAHLPLQLLQTALHTRRHLQKKKSEDVLDQKKKKAVTSCLIRKRPSSCTGLLIHLSRHVRRQDQINIPHIACHLEQRICQSTDDEEDVLGSQSELFVYCRSFFYLERNH